MSTPIRAIIIDDEPLAHKVILQYAKDVPFLEIIGQCYQATQAYALLATAEVDLLFLDIQMPKLKGLDFLRTLDQRPHVIITSAYEEYALEGYELQVADYLLKPFRFDRFLRAINKVRQQLVPKETLAASKEEQLFLKVDKRYVQIQLSSILYLESYGNYVKVWTGSSYLLTPRTLSSFETELPTDQFLRIHKSYLVQQREIDFIEGNRLVLKGGQELLIGKSYRSSIRQWLGR
ncbi:MAG: LytTR family DNA-binding domain-containing protein [Bacteroidota bacterium]